MLYRVFILAVLAVVIYLTTPKFIFRIRHSGEDVLALLEEERKEALIKIFLRMAHGIISSFLYYPTFLIAIPIVVLYVISNDIGLQIISYIAAGAVIFLYLRFGLWLWRRISDYKPIVEIEMPNGKRYEGRLVSEEIVTKVVIRVQGIDTILASGTLLEEGPDFIEVETSTGSKTFGKGGPFETLDIERSQTTEATIYKEGIQKTGRKIHIMGKNPFKDFLGDIPELLLILYLWYILIVLAFL